MSSRMAWYAAVARWAPSKHNTQPWRFVIRDESLEFWTDPTRTLTATDGHQREMFIACGAAIHLAVLAAHAAGHQVRVHVLPDGDDGPAARIRETGSHSATMDDLDLFGAIARRRTDRGPLDADALPADLPFTLQAAAAAYAASFRMATTPGDRATLADLVQRADRLLLQRGLVDRELAPWLHSPEVARRDGVPTDHTRGAAASVRAEFVQRDFSTANSRPAQDRVGPDRPLVGVLCTPTDRVSDWLATGQALASLLLRATLAGANSSFLNQPVEEAAIRSQLRDQLSLTGVAQLVLRLGVGGEVLPTPRRYLRDVIHHA